MTQPIVITTPNDRIELDGHDVADLIHTFAYERGPNGSFVHITFRADVEIRDELLPEAFDINGGPVKITVAEVEQTIVDAMVSGYTGQDAYGTAVIRLLQSKGLRIDSE